MNRFTRCVLLFQFWVGMSAQAPSITYNTPVVLTVNSGVSLLCSNSGGGIPSQPVVATLAGTGVPGSANGIGSLAGLNFPTVVTKNILGDLIVVDRSNHKIRGCSLQGAVTTIAGTGSIGSLDGPALNASFKYPDGAISDSQGNIFISDQSNHLIRKIDINGNVSTFAGSTPGFADGLGTSAKFYYPAAMAVDAFDNIYVADWNNHRIRKITPVGQVTTIAGSVAGYQDGISTMAKFNGPTGLAVDGTGVIYVADYANHRIRKIDTSGQVSTIAGSGVAGSTDGVGGLASFNHPAVVAMDLQSNLFVTDEGNHKIRKINGDGLVTTFAGIGTSGATDGNASEASFNKPTGIVVDSNNRIYIADYANHKIRKITTYKFSVTPNLPSGLELNPSTGEIHGFPTQVLPPANYLVTADNAEGSSSFLISIEIKDVLSNSEVNNLDFSVYPSPAKNFISLCYKDSKINQLVIIDVLGKQMLSRFNISENEKIDVSSLSNGIYTIEIKTVTETKRIKFVKK